MKRLLFAIAGAAAFSAFAADPTAGANDISIVGFENYTADQTVIGYGDNGVSGNSLWTCAGDDASLVKAYGGDNAAAPNIKEPAPFDGAAENAKYLALDTNGSELTRAIPAAGQSDAGTYIDTLVQFTPSESAPTAGDLTGAKLAIWLGVVNNVTNLYVQGGYLVGPEGDGDVSIDTTATQAYKLGNIQCEPGQWYRLTVKSVVMDNDGLRKVTGFQIFVDGTLAVSDTAVCDANAIGFYESLGSAQGILDGVVGLLTAKTIIPTCAGVSADPTLTAVGFKGTGAIDDFVVTTAAPDLAPAAIDFTLTWPSGVTPVSYKIGDGEPVSISSETSPFAVPGLVGGETVSFTFTNADGVTKTMSATAADDGDVDASTATYVWADYLGEAVSGAYQIDDANDLDMLRKGVAAGLATAGETFNQTANIDMSTAGPFAGIGTYNANLNSGVSFTGTYDGQGYKISNIDFTQRNYGGVFNQVKGGTIKNLTVDTITCSTFDSSANSGEWGCAIVGNAGLGATLQGLTAMGSFGSAGTPCTHNVAGIAIRVCGGASNVVNGVTMLETLVKDCTNNATLYGSYTKCAGITALTQDQNGVPNDYALFDGCVNNSNIAMVAGKGTEGRDGLSGILGYVADGTKMQNCVNNGTLTSVLATAKIGGIVGWAQGRFLDDLGGNVASAALPMVGSYADSYKDGAVSSHCEVTGFQYATVDNGVATTVTELVAGNTYLLEGDVPDSDTPVATLTAVGDTISFDTALGYTFAGTVASSGAAGNPRISCSGTVTTYTAGYFPRTARAGQDGTAANPYEIADPDDLAAFKAYVDNGAGRSLHYKLTADIDATSLSPWAGVGTFVKAPSLDTFPTGKGFDGVLDGNGKTISNVTFAKDKTYGGFFNTLDGTVKDLTINVAGFEDKTVAEVGYAAFAGMAFRARIENCVATGTIGTTAKPATHTCGGFAVKSVNPVFVNCTNYVNIVNSLTDNPKIGGFVGLSEGAFLTNCWNYGNMTITLKTCGNAGNGAGGLIGYTQTRGTTISGGGNAGTIQSTDTTAAASETYPIYVGTIVAKAGSTVTVSDGTVAQADAASAGLRTNVVGADFATVSGNVATFAGTLAAGNSYKVMSAGATATFAFAEAGTIAFDTALFTPTYAITAAEGLTLTDATSGTVKTYTAEAPAPAGWVDNPDTIAEGTAVSNQYPTLAESPLAAADAKKLTVWAKANSVAFDDAGSTATETIVDAFLLNCAATAAAVAEEKEEFVLTITFDSEGNPVINTPAGKDYNGKLQLKGSNDLSTWTNTGTTAGYQFFKFELSL